MYTNLNRLAILACLALPLCGRQPVAAVAPPAPSRLDRSGDPLPQGAVARLGTLRFVHLGGLTAVAVSPDGKVVASGVTEGKDVYLGEKVLHQKDGFKLIEEGQRDTHTTLRLWDADQGTVVRELVTPDAPVSCLYFAPDGRSLFAGCGRFLCAWDIGTGKKLWQQEAIPGGRFHYGARTERLVLAKGKLVSLHGGTLICPVSKDGGVSFFYHQQKVVRFWDGKTGTSLPTPPALNSTIHAKVRIATLFHEAALSPDGRFVSVRVSRADPEPRKDMWFPEDKWKYTDRRLQIVDLGTGKVSHTFPEGKAAFGLGSHFPHSEPLFPGLAFSADGGTLAVAEEKEIALVEITSGRKRLLAKGVPAGLQLSFVGVTKQLAAKLGYDAIRVWDIATGEKIAPGPVHAHAFTTAHNSRVAAAIHGNTVRLISLRSGKAMHSFEGHRLTPFVRFGIHMKDTLLSRDGKMACLWDTGTWKQKEALVPTGEASDYSYFGWPISPDDGASLEKGLYVKNWEKRPELRDIRSGRLVRHLEGAGGPPGWPTFSAAGNRLVARVGSSFTFFDVGTGKSLSRLPGSEVGRLGFDRPQLSPHGTYFARNTFWDEKGDRIGLSEVSSGKLLRTLLPSFSSRKGRGSILRFHFSGDERILFGEVHEELKFGGGFSEEKVTVTLWAVASGEIIQEMVLHPRAYSFFRQALSESKVTAFALSDDRRLMALAKPGGKAVELWETASGTRRHELVGHDGPVVSLAFHPSGKWLASGSEDTTVLVWDLHRVMRPSNLRNEELAAHWRTLAQPDAEKAYAAIRALTFAPRDTVPFLKKNLRPVAHLKAGRLRRLLDDLDSAAFETRSAADTEIEGLGELVLAELEIAVRQKNDLEKQRRLEALLTKARSAARPFGTVEKLRQWRALEVLERVATPEAVGLVRDLAGGAPGARLTMSAREVLARLEARGTKATPAKR